MHWNYSSVNVTRTEQWDLKTENIPHELNYCRTIFHCFFPVCFETASSKKILVLLAVCTGELICCRAILAPSSSATTNCFFERELMKFGFDLSGSTEWDLIMLSTASYVYARICIFMHKFDFDEGKQSLRS